MSLCFLGRIFRPEHLELRAFNFVDQNRTVSYRELKERVEIRSFFLHGQGVRPGDRVLVARPDEDDLAVDFLALIDLGAVMVPVPPQITNFELTQILARLPVRFVLAANAFVIDHGPALSKSTALEAIFTEEDPAGSLPSSLTYRHPPQAQRGARHRPESIPDPKAVITCHFTMKGLGHPLGVEHTYEDYGRSIESCQEIFRFRPGLRLLTLLPCYPVFGLVTNLLYPLAHGCELVIQDKRIADVVRAIKRYTIDHVNLVPAVMEKMILEVRKQQDVTDFSRVCFVAGGSFVSADLHHRFQERFNSAPVQGYGLTETLPILTNRPETAKPGTLGTVMRKETQVKILDRRGHEVTAGKAGEICVSGPGVISRYLGFEDLKQEFFRGPWLRTGDLGYFDEEGHVVFLGRRLGFTKILGNMVDFREIEEVALSLTGVKEARSYLTVSQGREKLCLSLIVAKDFEGSRKEVLELCRSRLSAFKVPAVIKIYKSNLREVAP